MPSRTSAPSWVRQTVETRVTDSHACSSLEEYVTEEFAGPDSTAQLAGRALFTTGKATCYATLAANHLDAYQALVPEVTPATDDARLIAQYHLAALTAALDECTTTLSGRPGPASLRADTPYTYASDSITAYAETTAHAVATTVDLSTLILTARLHRESNSPSQQSGTPPRQGPDADSTPDDASEQLVPVDELLADYDPDTTPSPDSATGERLPETDAIQLPSSSFIHQAGQALSELSVGLQADVVSVGDVRISGLDDAIEETAHGAIGEGMSPSLTSPHPLADFTA